ncbi:unnamed protein product [Lactuca virosa]|uniref:Uncharacterized protein n=1 Tax=Lactuca virosa TaxID=75947 RepID=A0AAU9MNT6_9ASTR|nr:unnamed protein product [Lactuca virosa]
MGTEVLHPQDFLPKVAPVIVWKTYKNDKSYPTPINNNTLRKPQSLRFSEKTGSTPRRERKLKPNHEDGDDSYAGSGFFHSPSPRSLPLPSFFNKKQDSMAMAADHDGFDDSATKHLRQLLRLG